MMISMSPEYKKNIFVCVCAHTHMWVSRVLKKEKEKKFVVYTFLVCKEHLGCASFQCVGIMFVACVFSAI